MKHCLIRHGKKYLLALMLASTLPAASFTPAGPRQATDPAFLAKGRQMMTVGNFRGTIDQLDHIKTENIPLSTADAREFLFLLGSAYYETADPRCLRLLEEFVRDYPAAADARRASALIADFYFFAHDWQNALQAYDSLDIDTFDTDTRNICAYRKALCLIKTGDFQAARPLIKSVASDKELALAATYYDAYLDYTAGFDDRALAKFEKVALEIGKADVAPQPGEEFYPGYYMAQIYFRRGEWENCVKMAINQLRRKNVADLRTDTNRVLGLSLFKLGDLSQAQGPLETYVDAAGPSATPDAIYALGACQYAAGQYANAAEKFNRVADQDNAVGQGALLYLGQMEAANGNPSAAALYFEKAYRMNYDPTISETALYDYVAARSKGGNIPFDSSVEMLQTFIKEYADSRYAPAIERHLASLFYTQGDYDKALRTIDRITRPTPEDLAILQKILYAAGATRLSAGDPRRAAELLQRCTSIRSSDPNLTCQANIWLGDALYAQSEYAAAERAYMAAANSGHAGNNAALLDYDLGYALLMQDKFSRARQYFLKASSSSSLPADLRHDAEMRIADCKYYTGDYQGALADFAKMRDGANADYALYRHAQMLGLNGDIAGKIRELEKFEREHSGSRWLQNALSELADTYASAGDNAKAAAAYGRMLDKYPVAPGAARALLGRATALMAAGDTEVAVETYRKILTAHPASDEARSADRELRRYYASTHQLPEYAAFIATIPGFSLDAADLDDLAYSTAENEYLDDDSRIDSIEDYIIKYPSGRHIAEAYSIYAAWFNDSGDRQRALAAYRELERRGGATYATEAYTGIMRNADNSAVQLEYARKLRQAGGADADALEEADFYEAEALSRSGSARDAREGETMLRRLAGNPFSLFGARSAVTLAQQYLDNGDAAAARDAMEEFTSSGSGQQYWVARGFIVLADAYTALGKDTLAREYLRSLKQNYPGDEADIKRMIDKRLR
ncbi:MAG: tetratricopeptide repeat protein [Muribaculaceae bacterium]|nr:tetratricopeptide repeat protein [Muribaculaceae bacterium]